MALKRVYQNWQQVNAASGTPSSAARRAWRQHLATRPAIAYWGDSWFSTPLYRNLCWNSFSRIDGMALRLGGPGLSARQMCTPRACANNAERLASREFDLLCVSIGGNDCLGEDLKRMFAGVERMDVDAAFERVQALGAFAELRERYAILLRAMRGIGGDFRVVGHGYAPLQAAMIGEPGRVNIKTLGLIGAPLRLVGPWLWPAMRPVLVSRANAAAFARRMLLDGLRDQVLVPSRRDFPGLFSFADFSELAEPAQPGFWYDEIHPTEEGFGILAGGLNAMLRVALPAAKRAAVG